MIEVSLTLDSRDFRFSEKEVQRVVLFVCKKEKKKNAEFSFIFTDDKKIKAINTKFLSHNFVTDIITFSLDEKYISAEVYINIQQANRQAKEFGVTIKNEMMRLVVHGTLHALGYDDTNDADKKLMFDRQERYVENLSL